MLSILFSLLFAASAPKTIHQYKVLEKITQPYLENLKNTLGGHCFDSAKSSSQFSDKQIATYCACNMDTYEKNLKKVIKKYNFEYVSDLNSKMSEASNSVEQAKVCFNKAVKK